ncbi:MAG TPA: CrcB family protein [Ktedonobacterales bacterium]
MIRKLLLTLAGGFCGAVTRYLLAKPLLALAGALPGAHVGFPYDTLLINLTGAFVIGLLFGAFEHGAPLSPDLRLALGTGFLGAYTTFSSFVVGAASELQHGQALTALLYLCGAMAGGVALAFAGFTLAGHLIERWWAASLDAQASALAGDDWVDGFAMGGTSAEKLELADERIAELEGGAR